MLLIPWPLVVPTEVKKEEEEGEAIFEKKSAATSYMYTREKKKGGGRREMNPETFVWKEKTRGTLSVGLWYVVAINMVHNQINEEDNSLQVVIYKHIKEPTV